MLWFDKTPEEKAAAAKQEHEEIILMQRGYISDRTGVDIKNVREAYKDDEESLNATFNSLSGARYNRWDPLESTCRHASLSIL